MAITSVFMVARRNYLPALFTSLNYLFHLSAEAFTKTEREEACHNILEAAYPLAPESVDTLEKELR